VPSERYREVDCLQDIIDNIARIERYVEGLDQDRLRADDLRHDAVERCLERICEAAFRLGDRANALLPAHPWPDIRGMGNRLRHGYDQIDTNIVWNVVSERLPSLKADAVAALERLADQQEPEPP
jgi:uncharacterized protein with HEPN domain